MLLEIARYCAAIPKEQRRRTITFVTTPDHHHGATGVKWINQNMRELPRQDRADRQLRASLADTDLSPRLRSHDVDDDERAPLVRGWQRGAQARGAGSLREFGVAVYARPKASRWRTPARLYAAPSFHVIDPHFYHSDADTADLVPAWGIEAVARAYLKIIDSVNKMEISELAAESAKSEPAR